MARDEKLEMLRTVPMFARLGRHELERLGGLCDEVNLPAGRVLMRQGENGSEAMVIAEGRARVERDGRLVSERGPGDVVGEMALLSEGPRVATVTLTEASRLLVIGHRDFHSLMDDVPAFKEAVYSALAHRIREMEPDAGH